VSEQYEQVHPGLVRCARCAALLLDTDDERALHDRFHDGLRRLWRQAGQGSQGGQGGGR
jgi:hypothetical protein